MTKDLTGIRYCIYVRKSSVEEDRQELSLESQISELQHYAKREGIEVLQTFQDSASAHKVNNRPSFNEMMQAIQRGKINGILTWDPNRLARNMQEGGVIIDQLQHSIIRIIETPAGSYFPDANTLVLTIKFGTANQYSLDLSRTVKRGNKTKIEKGGWCGPAPFGYLNNVADKTVCPDPDRFEMLQKLFRLYAKGQHSLKTLCKMSEEWGLQSKKGRKMTKAWLHRIFQNPFYYGQVRKGEHKGKGIHEPMITVEEFQKVQGVLRARGHKRPKTTVYKPYTCFMKCGTCASGITAEEKVKYKCPNCNAKQTAKKPKTCKCGAQITKGVIDTARRYYYYHCTAGSECEELCSRKEQLEDQFLGFIRNLEVNEVFVEWAKRWIDHFFDQKEEQEKREETARTKAIKVLRNKVIRLTDLRMDGELEKGEFLDRKDKLQKEIEELEFKNNTQPQLRQELKEEFSFLVGLGNFFENGEDSEKDGALRRMVSNPTLKGGKVFLQAKKLYLHLPKLKRFQKGGIEPRKSLSEKELTGDYIACSNVWRAAYDAVRTPNAYTE